MGEQAAKTSPQHITGGRKGMITMMMMMMMGHSSAAFFMTDASEEPEKTQKVT